MNLDIQFKRKHEHFNFFVQNIDSEQFRLYVQDTSNSHTSHTMIHLGDYQIPNYDDVIDEFIPTVEEWE